MKPKTPKAPPSQRTLRLREMRRLEIEDKDAPEPPKEIKDLLDADGPTTCTGCKAPWYVPTRVQMFVSGQVPCRSDWQGWRFTPSGVYLVSPTGVRMTPRMLLGLAWKQQAEWRLQDARERNKKRVWQGVVTMLRTPSNDWHREAFGTLRMKAPP
jgi:hypothetical protein